MNGRKTYFKQYNENTAIRACTNVIKTCHGHILNVCFSATLWTFHFETAAKRAARYIIMVLQKCIETRISNEPGLPLEVPVAKHSAFWDVRLGLCMCTGWSSMKKYAFLMLFEQKKQHLWDRCCQISLVIPSMKFNHKFGKQFWRIWCFPIQRDRSCTCMPKRRFKDGRRVKWLALKGKLTQKWKLPHDVLNLKAS